MIESMFEDIALSIMMNELEHNVKVKAGKKKNRKAKISQVAETHEEEVHEDHEEVHDEDHSEHLQVTGVKDITNENHDDLTVETIPKINTSKEM